MKFSVISAIALLAFVPQTITWRDEMGEIWTWAGEGAAGTKCFGSLGTLNNEAFSMHFYYADSAGTTACCLSLYDSPNCQTKDVDWTPKV
ncbi:hypothetical protein B0O99DRAFT_623896 [Bisporella sp. PMI_857]|nr:hypothetical protein B0O99DRAFT_623896 [Bisporella sp. PMI_857]